MVASDVCSQSRPAAANSIESTRNRSSSVCEHLRATYRFDQRAFWWASAASLRRHAAARAGPSGRNAVPSPARHSSPTAYGASSSSRTCTARNRTCRPGPFEVSHSQARQVGGSALGASFTLSDSVSHFFNLESHRQCVAECRRTEEPLRVEDALLAERNDPARASAQLGLHPPTERL